MTSTNMCAPGTPETAAVHPDIEPPFPDCKASTHQVHHWIRTWHIDHGIEVDLRTLNQVTWTGPWIHEQPPAQLESEIIAWGVPQQLGRMMVLDLVRERRGQTKIKQVCVIKRERQRTRS
jgi:hypothetical protein